MGRVEGKVALVTGAARGQGRSHAIRLAAEGADIIAVDNCADVGSVPYHGGTEEDLALTIELVEALDRRIVASVVDVRDFESLSSAINEGVSAMGRLDIVCANAGIIMEAFPTLLEEEDSWRTVIDINLTGVWLTCKAAVPFIVDGGCGGSVVLTSSVAGLKGHANIGSYVASKHGIVGLMRTLANELAPYLIRVNSIHPTQVDTPMIMNDTMARLFVPHRENPTHEEFAAASRESHAMPIPWVEAIDVSNAVLFLASDESRFITGVTLPIDAGSCVK